MALDKITSDSISPGAVNTTALPDGAITSAKLHTTAISDKLGYIPVSPTQLSTAVANLVNSAPSTLDTLNELSSALGNDANFATTVTTALATKAPLQEPSFTGQYIKLPSGTTAQRPVSPSAGMLRFNTDFNYTEEYRGGQWLAISNVFVAEGGITNISGGYKYHVFITSGTFNVLSGSNQIQYLVVGGGGSGGARHGGGGGAGGYIAGGPTTVTAGVNTITIGAGGTGVEGNGVLGNSGSNSVFSFTSTTALGGGSGGVYGDGGSSIQAGRSGGSGGGSPYNGAAGSGTSGQGNAGAGNTSGVVAGGGGGASAVGGVGNGSGGVGGAGAQWYDGYYYAGGGGGGAWDVGSGGNGGIGGGGGGNKGNSGSGGTGGGSARNSGGNGQVVLNNNVITQAGNGGTNTGGGGGGADQSGYQTYRGMGGNGGSGIVIIRYPV